MKIVSGLKKSFIIMAKIIDEKKNNKTINNVTSILNENTPNFFAH